MDQVIGGGSSKLHPAFIVSGVERDGFYISKYLNTDVDGKGCSLPASIPCNRVGIDLALEKSTAKGRGWHLVTVQEWGAVALWCKRNGHLPYGNNDFGRDRRESIFKAIPAVNVENGKGRILTGTGPLSWSHDNTASGIRDLNGNLSEWVGGIKAVYGEIQVMPGNDGADLLNTHDADSPAWRAIDAATGEYIMPDGKGTTKGSVKLDYVDDPMNGWSSRWVVATGIKNQSASVRRCNMAFVRCDETIGPEARELMIAFGLIPDDPLYDYKDQYVYHNNGAPECFIYRGGTYSTGPFADIFVWSCSFGRAHISENQGFRAAYIEL